MKRAEQIGAELAGKIKGDVAVDIFSRVAFSTDAGIYSIRPECVVSPRDAQDVVETVRYAFENKIPIAARGAGSGLAGESLTSGIVIDFRRYMKRIISAASDGSTVVCQPGVVLDELNRALAPYKKTIGPDPSSSNRAVVGGLVANNATGSHSLAYGHIDDYVAAVTAVLYDGTVARLENNIDPASCTDPAVGGLARQCVGLLAGKEQVIQDAQPATSRNRCGYTIADILHDGKIDLAKLMAGSEGTLAVFTEITLCTVELPAMTALIQFEFDSMGKMAEAIPVIVEAGAAACELMDKTLTDMARLALPQYRDILPAGCVASLLVEQFADDETMLHRRIERTISAVGGLARRAAPVFDQKHQQKLWKSRKDAVPLLNRQKGPKHPVPFIEDVSVDPSCLDRYIRGLEEISGRYDTPMAFYGHAGDGELHIRPYLDLSAPEDLEKMRSIAEEVFELAWSLGGSISGEHAVGLLRAPFIKQQYGAEYYDLLAGIKNIFDPVGLLNPGKILNDDPDVFQKNLNVLGLDASRHFKTALAFKGEQFRYELEQCNGCGVCLATAASSRMCPAFRAMDTELASSRAKVNLFRAWLNPLGGSPRFDPAELKKILSLCLNCRMCSIECPAGVDVSRLMVEARAHLARHTGFSSAELALSANRIIGRCGSAFAPLSNFVFNLPFVRFILEKTIGLDRNRKLPPFQRGSFIKKARKYLADLPSAKTPVDKVVYFADSFVEFYDHQLGFAVLKLLHCLGIETAVPGQLPAPVSAYVYGNLKAARKDASKTVQSFLPWLKKGYTIVCSEPSAAMFLVDELPVLLDNEQTLLIAKNTLELMDYLNRLRKQGRIKLPLAHTENIPSPLAYHSPCHLRVLNGAQASLELLGDWAGLPITDLDSGCCGLAGTAGMQKKNAELADAVGRPLAEAIAKLNPELILSECAACNMQIERLTGKKVVHPASLLCRLLGIA